MAIRNTGQLPITDIVTEFGGTTPHGLSEYYGNGTFLSPGYFPNPPALPSTGSPLNVGAFYGKSKRRVLNVTISQNTSDLNVVPLFSTLLAQSTIPADCFLTINAGVTVYGTLNTALVVAADTSLATKFRSVDTLTIINNGKIIGYAGTGGDGGCGAGIAGSRGTAGGAAINLARPTTIINYGTIAGGGTGGTGGTGGVESSTTACSDATQCGSCQRTFNCTRYAQQNYISGYQRDCRGGECCDSRSAMQFMSKNMSDQCWCGSCKDTPRDPGCYGQCRAQYSQKDMACQQGYNSYRGSCDSSTKTCGGKGGNGASVFSNTAIAGGAPTGAGGATVGNSGTLWGGTSSILGSSFLTSKNIGGTVFGPMN